MLYHFLRQDAKVVRGRMLFMLLASGAATGIMVSVINTAVVQLSDAQVDLRLLLLYTLVFMLYVYSQKYSLEYSIYRMEDAIYSLRMRIVDKLIAIPLRQQEIIAAENWDDYLSSEVDLTAQLLPWVSYFAQSMSILLFCLLYLAWVSVAGFLILFLALVSAVLWHLFVEVQTYDELDLLHKEERSFSAILRRFSIQAGRIRLNPKVKENMQKQGDKIASKSRDIRLAIDKQVISSVMSTRMAIFILLAIFIFALPALNASDAETVFKISIAAFFVVTASAQLVYGLPYLLRLNLALQNIYQLEKRLDASTWNKAILSDSTGSFTKPIEQLQFQGIYFNYPPGKYVDKPFSLPTLDLEVRAGEVVILQGGNSAGKTTATKLLAGLYLPASGTIKVNGQPVTAHENEHYRELFALVSADQVCDRLYHPLPDKNLVNTWLSRVNLEQNLYYRDGFFYHDRLSISQQQRLAMVIAILEDKAIYVFDDLDSFQDQEFLTKFYTDVIPELKANGKILFITTRNNNFLDYANQVVGLK
jgi:putative pyoverdin transport system ATP-binding/permease protein